MGIESTPSAGLSPTLKLAKPLSAATADEIRAAAAAALKGLPVGRSTVFFVDSDESSGADEGNGPDTPTDASSKPPASEPAANTPATEPTKSPLASPTAAINPLASLLGGYSDDDASGGADDSPRATSSQHKDLPSAQPEQQHPGRQDLQQQHQEQQPLQSTGDHMDSELASFLQELESSGLLADTDAEMDTASPVVPEVQGGDANTTADIPAEAANVVVPAESTSEMGMETENDAGASATPELAAGVAATDSAETAAAAAAAADGPAEQRTLGQLIGAPEWFKVLDTGSGKHYYWNVNTNDVLWEPPEGADGDALVPAFDEDVQNGSTEAAAAADSSDIAAGSKPAAAVAADETGHDLQEADLAANAAVAEGTAASAAVQQGDDAQQQAKQLDVTAKTELPAGMSAAPQVTETAPITSAHMAGAAAAAQQQLAAQPVPQQDVQAVFLTLLAELQMPAAAKQLLQQLPEALKITWQLQLLHQQWQAFAAQQQSAADSGQPNAGFSWVNYELYIMQQLQQVVQRLQPAVKELERLANKQQIVGVQPQQQQQQQHKQQEPEPADAGGPSAGKLTRPDQATPTYGGEAEAAAAAESVLAAAAAADSSEEGEVAASDSEGEDMDLDSIASPKAVTAKQQTPPKAAGYSGTAAADADGGGRYTAAGTYASTAHMPSWARPTYHYDFHAYPPGGYGYDFDAYHHAYAAADYRHHFGAAGYGDSAYNVASYAGYGGYDTAAYHDAAVAATGQAGADAAGGGATQPPPLPVEAPPPLPEDEPVPPGEPQSQQRPLPGIADAECTAADGTATAAAPARRKAVVGQPAVRKPALAADSVPPVVLAGSTGDARKRLRDKESKQAVPTGKLQKAGKMSALISKWASVRQQQEEEEQERQRRAEEAADPEVQEAKRLKQLEAWRLSQLQSGAAEDNPNFAPVLGDWRARLGLGSDAAAAVTADDDSAGGPAAATAAEGEDQAAAEKAARKAARKAAKAAKAATAAAAAAAEAAASKWPTNSKTKPDLHALSQGLPPGWQAMWDKASGDIYYGNPTTKEVSWDRPTE